MPIDPHTFRSPQVRDYLEQTFRHVAEQKDLAVRDPHGPGTCRTTIFSDINRLQQILKNLLSNAFKFTATGGVTLTVQRAGRERGEDVLAFAVRDTGIGIPIEKQRLIFEAFQQADGTTSRKYGGTGLGLTISREIARLLGGSIEVVSAPGEGSTFTLFLPARYAGAEDAREDGATKTGASRGPRSPPSRRTRTSRGSRCSSSTTTQRNLFALKSALEERGIRVLHAENGRVAIDTLKQHDDVDLVLMDTMMPEMDGLSATRAIRERRPLPLAADHLAHGEGDDGRPREGDRGRRDRLRDQARRLAAAPRGRPLLGR